jgi:hypothetical protein
MAIISKQDADAAFEIYSKRECDYPSRLCKQETCKDCQDIEYKIWNTAISFCNKQIEVKTCSNCKHQHAEYNCYMEKCYSCKYSNGKIDNFEQSELAKSNANMRLL